MGAASARRGDDAVAVVASRALRLVERDAAHVADPQRLVALRTLAAVPARHGRTARPVRRDVLDAFGVRRLYTHQAEAIDLVRAGRSVVLATSTASGKSLVAQVAISEAAADADRPGTALCIYPTKALAQDQLRALTLADLPGVEAATYDGDVDPTMRAHVRRNANVVLTNPEMLHCGLLPHHAGWVRFWSRLRTVVIDEIHSYRGVFGAHVAHLLRRVRRIAAHYGASPTFICASATVGDPGGLASTLCGVDVVPVTDDGSPSGRRTIAIWNPPVLDVDEGRRASPHHETAGLVADLARAGHPTIAFCPSRRTVETVTERVRRQLRPAHRRRVAAYRGGYLAEERLAVEDALDRGQLDAVVTTSALEVGIDARALEVVVLDGFPGTVAGFWQRVGRAGRGAADSLAVLVCGQDQLDQWIAANPEALFERPPEPVVVNPANPTVADAHVRCAAFELPLTHDDRARWPDVLDEAVCRLAADGALRVRAPGQGTTGGRGRRQRLHATSPTAVWAGHGWPTDGVGLRSGAAGTVKIVRADGTPVGTVDVVRAGAVVHAGAVYLHAGQTYRVLDLDLGARRAVVEPERGSTTTVASTQMDLRVLGERVRGETGPLGDERYVADLEVTTQVTGYVERDLRTGERVAREPLDLPPAVLRTRGVVRTVPEEALLALGLDRASWPGVLHAAEHAAIGVLPLFAICDRWDVGGISTARHADTGTPTIVIYDGHPGGSGIAELGFEVSDEHLRVTASLVASCGCRDGCPSCVQSPKCGNGNEPLDRHGAAVLLGALAGDAGRLRSAVGRAAG